ncbi:MAG: hypothetical protein ACLPJH_10050 [Myxococcaceae bacterium]
MKLKKLFHALVLAGAALGIAHCGGGTTPDPAGSSSTGGTSLLPDGGLADGGTGMGFPPGAPGGW